MLIDLVSIETFLLSPELSLRSLNKCIWNALVWCPASIESSSSSVVRACESCRLGYSQGPVLRPGADFKSTSAAAMLCALRGAGSASLLV